MKKGILVLCAVFFCLVSCNNDDDSAPAPVASNQTVLLKFSHNWDGIPITNDDFNALQFTNAKGDVMSIERLRYLISNIVLTKSDGTQTFVNDYQLIDVTNGRDLEKQLTFEAEDNFSLGEFSNVSFTFGFNNLDNSQNYIDLNSASFNVPDMLGGGYHYMQLDGKFRNAAAEDQGYNFHAIRAVDNPGNPTFPQDTFFNVDLGGVNLTSNTSTIEIKMNVAEWFKSPNMWDLNVLNQMLMPNSSAQIMISENGRDAFSLGEVTNE